MIDVAYAEAPAVVPPVATRTRATVTKPLVTSAPKQSAPVPSGAAVDLDKLAIAVATHETCSCTCGSAKYNNCFGIRYNGTFAHYKTKEDSYADFKRIWAKPTGYYRGQYPTLSLAKTYTGNDRAVAWLSTVTRVYESL